MSLMVQTRKMVNLATTSIPKYLVAKMVVMHHYNQCIVTNVERNCYLQPSSSGAQRSAPHGPSPGTFSS
jgi:hypothetical protein